jgi:hypothetical protein
MVTVATLASTAAADGWPRMRRLWDGSVGYYSRRDGDCWPAAMARCLGIHIDLVPDAHAVLDAGLGVGVAWRRLDVCLEMLGVRRVRHTQLPVAARRWIGVVPGDAVYFRHAFVMSEGELLHDPDPETSRVLGVGPADCGLGYSFTTEDREERPAKT